MKMLIEVEVTKQFFGSSFGIGSRKADEKQKTVIEGSDRKITDEADTHQYRVESSLLGSLP